MFKSEEDRNTFENKTTLPCVTINTITTINNMRFIYGNSILRYERVFKVNSKNKKIREHMSSRQTIYRKMKVVTDVSCQMLY